MEDIIEAIDMQLSLKKEHANFLYSILKDSDVGSLARKIMDELIVSTDNDITFLKILKEMLKQPV